jgi:hypothetical protein
LVQFNVGQVAGTLYAYGRSLYITLSQYASANEAGAAGITNPVLSFVPEAAKRPDTYLDAGSTGRTLVIDYPLLDRLSAASALPASSQAASPAAARQPEAREKMDPPSQESEIEALRKELQEIKKQLAEQQAERARSQPQKPLPP